jgi:hypothetical protein
VGIRLFVEVMQFAPSTLTHREKLLLVALAEDANDDSRQTWNSVEDPKILRGAMVTRAQLYAVLKKLSAKGVLKKVAAGQRNGTAKYEILPLAAQCPQFADTDGRSQSPRIADTDASQCQQNADTDEASQCQEKADTDASQCQQIADFSVSKLQTPTPQDPSTTSKQEGEPATVTGGIPDAARPLVDAVTAAGVIVRWPFRGNQWFPVLTLVADHGIPAMVDHAVKAASRTTVESAKYFLKGWSELPPIPAADTPRPQLRAVSGGWQPYCNPTDHSVYENGF